MNSFSYTVEMLIQAGRTGVKVDWVPIGTNPKTRDSRLFRSNLAFIIEQLKIMLVAYLFYCPMRFFNWLAASFFGLSLVMAGRIAYYLWFSEPAQMKFKTGSGVLLLFSSVVTVLLFVTGLLSSVLSGQRFLLNDIRSRIRNIQLESKIPPEDLHIWRAPEFSRWTTYQASE
jgi:hypothetical protein